MAASPAGRQGGSPAGRLGKESAQAELANLALLAFEGAEATKLMATAARVVREGLGVEFASVMELSADGNELVLRAGEGWRHGAVGRESLAVGVNSDVGFVSMAAYALWDRNPVRVENLVEDPRFGGCPLMTGHGVVSGVMAKIRVGGRVFGTIGAHSVRRRIFTEEEAAWLGDLAKMLGGGLGHGLVQDRRVGGGRDAGLQDTMERIAASADGGSGALVETARIAATELADWCFVDLLEAAPGVPSGRMPGRSGARIRRIAIGGSVEKDSGRQLAEELSYPLDPAAPHGTPKVLRSGEPELIRRVDDEVLRRSASAPERLGSLRKLEPKSYMVVPIRLFLRTVGTLVLVSTDPSRLFDESSLERAKQLARCAALVLAGRLPVQVEGYGYDKTETVGAPWVGRETGSWFDSEYLRWSDKLRVEYLSALKGWANKLLSKAAARRALCPGPRDLTLDLRTALSTVGALIVLRFPVEAVDEEPAHAMARFFTKTVQDLTLRRLTDARTFGLAVPPLSLFLDELPTLVGRDLGDAMSTAQWMALARKQNVSVTVAHQGGALIGDVLSGALDTNARTKFIAPGLGADDLLRAQRTLGFEEKEVHDERVTSTGLFGSGRDSRSRGTRTQRAPRFGEEELRFSKVGNWVLLPFRGREQHPPERLRVRRVPPPEAFAKRFGGGSWTRSGAA